MAPVGEKHSLWELLRRTTRKIVGAPNKLLPEGNAREPVVYKYPDQVDFVNID